MAITKYYIPTVHEKPCSIVHPLGFRKQVQSALWRTERPDDLQCQQKTAEQIFPLWIPLPSIKTELSYSKYSKQTSGPGRAFSNFSSRRKLPCTGSDVCPWGWKVRRQIKDEQEISVYTECPRRNVKYFRRVFLMLNYTDITQNTCNQCWTVTEIMAREFWNFDSCYTYWLPNTYWNWQEYVVYEMSISVLNIKVTLSYIKQLNWTTKLSN